MSIIILLLFFINSLFKIGAVHSSENNHSLIHANRQCIICMRTHNDDVKDVSCKLPCKLRPDTRSKHTAK